MNDDILAEQVRVLRAQGGTPKQIARALGLIRSRVTEILNDNVEAAGSERLSEVRCWVNDGWRSGLDVRGHDDWPGASGADTPEGGLVAVLVARRHRYDKISVCGYLVDVYCLGVKNALGPEIMAERGLIAHRQMSFDVFAGGGVRAPLELAQQLVFGGVEHARRLGFAPHEDFAAVEGHLGSYDGRCDIAFGLHEKPYYVQGPYDDAAHVMATLGRTDGAQG